MPQPENAHAFHRATITVWWAASNPIPVDWGVRPNSPLLTHRLIFSTLPPVTFWQSQHKRLGLSRLPCTECTAAMPEHLRGVVTLHGTYTTWRSLLTPGPTWAEWLQQVTLHGTYTSLLAPGPTRTAPGHSESSSLQLTSKTTGCGGAEWKLPTTFWSLIAAAAAACASPFSASQSSAAAWGWTPFHLPWLSSGPISSCLRTFLSHCCGSSQSLINLPAIHWAALFFSHKSRRHLTSYAELSSLKSNLLTSYKILPTFSSVILTLNCYLALQLFHLKKNTFVSANLIYGLMNLLKR